MPRFRVGWIFVSVVFLSVFKEATTATATPADVSDLPKDLTHIDAENLDGHVEISTLDVLPTATPGQEHSTTHRTRKFLKWPSRRPAFRKHNGLSAIAASHESYPIEMDSTTKIRDQTTQSEESQTTKPHNRGSYRYVPPKSSVTRGHSSSTTTEFPTYTRVTTEASSKEKSALAPQFRKFLMRRKPEIPAHSSENVHNETRSVLSSLNLGLKLNTSERSEIITGEVEVSSKQQEKPLEKGGEVVEQTKALLESEQNDQEKFFKETGTETGTILFESGDSVDSDLFGIDQNDNKFLMTEKPLEKVTVLLPASFHVKDVDVKHDLEEVATIFSDIQQPYEEGNDELKGTASTTMKYVDKIFNLEATGSSKANAVDESHFESSADATTTTEHDKLTRLHKFHKSRYHPRTHHNDNSNGKSRKDLDTTTTEYTTTQNNAEPEHSTPTQVKEIVNTTEAKHKIPHKHKYLNLKHKNSTTIHLADISFGEKPTGNYVTTEPNKLVDEESKGFFTSQLRESSLNENSTDVNVVPTKYPHIINMHRLPHMKPKNFTTTPPTENSIPENSSDVNKKWAKHDLKEGVTISTAIQHSHEKANEEAERITITTTGTTANPVDEILIEKSADTTATTITTAEHDKLSRVHKFHKSRYHSRAHHNDNVNENSRRYLDRTTTEFTTTQNNAEPEHSTPTQVKEIVNTTEAKHKIPHMHKYLNLKHKNFTTIHLADISFGEKPTGNYVTTEPNKLVEESKGSFTSQLRESSLNENSTDVKVVPTKHPHIIHMHRLPHMKPKNFTITPPTENRKEGVTISTAIQHSNEKANEEAERITITTTGTTANPVDEILIEKSADTTTATTITTAEHDELFRVHKFHKSRYHSRAHHNDNVNENSRRYLDRTTKEFTTIQNNAEPEDSATTQVNEIVNTTEIKHKIPHIHKYLNVKHENSTTIHLADTRVEEKPTENYVTTEPNKLVVEESNGSLTSQLKRTSHNDNSTENSSSGTSSDVNKKWTKHDLKEGVTISSNIQHSIEKANEEAERIMITTMKYIEATGTEANPVNKIPIENSAHTTTATTTTITTTEQDKLSQLLKFQKSRYHSRANHNDNVYENSRKYLDRTISEYTTIQNNAEPADSSTIQVDTTETKHTNSTTIHLAETNNEEKLTENAVTTEHNKILHVYQLVDEKSKGSFMNQLKASSLNENSTDFKIVSTKHPQIMHMHRLPHMNHKNLTTTPFIENNINGTSSEENMNLVKYGSEEAVTVSSDIQNPNEKASEEVDGITIPTTEYNQEIFNFEATSTTSYPVDENSADATATTIEHDKLSRLQKLNKFRFYPKVRHNENVNEHSLKYSNRTTEHITIQSNAEPENSAMQLTEKNFASTETNHKVPYLHKHLNFKHNNSTRIHLANTSVEEKSIENSESSINANVTETEHKSIRMQKLKNATSTHYSENSGNETSVDESTVHKIIHMPRLLNITPKYSTTFEIKKNYLNESSADEITISPETEIIHMQKNIDTKVRNSTTTVPSNHGVYGNSAVRNMSTGEHYEINHAQHLHTKLQSSLTTHFTEKSENESPIDANVAPVAHKVIHMHRFLNLKHKNVTTSLIKEENENDPDIDHTQMIHMNQLPGIKPSTHPAERSVDEISDANTGILQDDEVIHIHQYLNKTPEETTNHHTKHSPPTAHEEKLEHNPHYNKRVSIIEATEVVYGGETTTNEYSGTNLEHRRISDILETSNESTTNIQDSLTQKVEYSIKPTEIIYSTSQIEITPTPDYTSTIIENVTDENSERIQHRVHESLKVIESTLTGSNEVSTVIKSKEEINGSIHHNYKEITTSHDISTDLDNSSEFSKETSHRSSVSSTRTTTESATTVSSIGTKTVPLQQQDMSNKSTIPRRQYLLKRTTTASPIITDQKYGQEETVIESVVTSATIHLQQIHNGTTVSLNLSTLAETTTYEAPVVKNEDVTSESYTREATTETYSLITENVNESNDTTENFDEGIVTVDPAHWFGVNVDITTEVTADEKDIDFNEIRDAHTEEENTVIVENSVGSDAEDTTTRAISSTKQTESPAVPEANLDNTSVKKEELVTVDPAHWFGVIENDEKVETALENKKTLDNGNGTKTEYDIIVGNMSESKIQIGSRFGETLKLSNQTDVSTWVLTNVEDDMDDNKMKETSTTGVTMTPQHEKTVGEWLSTKKTAIKVDENENRNRTQFGLKDNQSDEEELHESMEIKTTKAGNISTIINNINQTIIPNNKIESTTKKSPSLSPDAITEHDNLSNSLTKNITDLPELADVQVTIIGSIASKHGDVSTDNFVSEVSKPGDKSLAFTEKSDLPTSNNSETETENKKHEDKELEGYPNAIYLDVAPEPNIKINITKLKEDALVSETELEESTNSIPVKERAESNVLVSEGGQSSEVALKNAGEIAATEDNRIKLDNEQRKMLFEKLGEVFKLNEDIENDSSTMSAVDDKMIDDDEETEEDGKTEEDDDGGSDYMDLYAINRTNHGDQDIDKESYVEKNILGKAANFSVQVKVKQQTIHMPSDVHISEDPAHLVLNFTWPSSENTYNYCLSLHLNESAGRYLINKMHLSFVKDNSTLVDSDQQEKDKVFVDLGEDIQVIFSNTDFLKIPKEEQEEENPEDLEKASKERQVRVLHMEIILGAVVVIGVIILVTYILIARKRKLKLRKDQNKDASSSL